MMRTLSLISILTLNLFFSSKLFAQKCDCEENVTSLNVSLKENYPGYADKTSLTPKYDKFYDSILISSRRAINDYQCYQILKKLSSYFRDPHLTLSINNTNANRSRIKEMFSDAPKAEEINNQVKKAKAVKDEIIGLWEIKDQGSYYMIEIEESTPGNFIGKIVKADSVFWQPNQIKCIISKKSNQLYTIKLFTRDHTPYTFDIKTELKYIIDMGAFGIWQRVVSLDKMDALNNEVKKLKNIEFKKLSDKTLYLRIPSFDISNYQALQDTIAVNMPKELTGKILIIDLRGNTGGSTIVSNLLLQYVYLDSIKYEGSTFKASKQNIDDFEQIMAQPAYNSIDKSSTKLKIDRFKQSPNALVPYTEKRFLTLDSIFTKPAEVYIIVNGFSASTSEFFVLQAKQNTRVKVIGQKTRGAIDYTDIGLPHSLPCSLFYIQLPMVRSNRIKMFNLDNIGITPDIIIPEDINSLSYLNKIINEKNKNR